MNMASNIVLGVNGSFYLPSSPSSASISLDLGTPQSPNLIPCVPDYVSSTPSFLICAVEAESLGSSLRFYYSFAGQSSVGDDRITITPIAPILTAVRGCNTTQGDMTADCPTDGGNLTITVMGTNFLPPFAAFVGGKECEDGTFLGSSLTSFACLLPKGTGKLQAVSVSSAGTFSEPIPLLSFRAPSIHAISGCHSDSSLKLSNCSRAGGDILTVYGSDFGEQGASVFVGSDQCRNVVHSSSSPHTMLTCQLPPGYLTDRSLLVLQSNGELGGSTATLSYTQCPPGSAAVVDGKTEVDPVTGVPRCLSCQPGSYSPDGQSCLLCPRGSVAPSPSASFCVGCPDFSSSTDGLKCVCSTGYYDISNELNQSLLWCHRCPEKTVCENGQANNTAGMWVYADAHAGMKSYSCPSGYCLPNKECAEGRKPFDTPNVLCGECLDGYSEWGGKCKDCSNGTNGGLVFLYLLFSWAYVLVTHYLSQSQAAGLNKIFMFFAQSSVFIVGGLTSLDWLDVFNFRPQNVLGSWFSASDTSCIAPLSPYERLLFNAFTPLIFVGELLLSYLVQCVVAAVRRWRFQRERFFLDFRPYIRTLFALFVFSYYQLADLSIRYLNCIDVGDYKVVATSPAMNCRSSSYKAHLALVIVIVVLDVVMGPIMMAWTLLKNQAKITNEDISFSKSYGILYQAYSSKCFWWEVVALLRRVVLVAIDAAFFDQPQWRFVGFAALFYVLTMTNTYFKPWATHRDNYLESLSLMVLVWLSTVMIAEEDPNDPSLGGRIIVIFLTFSTMAVFVYYIGQSLFGKVQVYLHRRRSTLGERERGISMGKLSFRPSSSSRPISPALALPSPSSSSSSDSPAAASASSASSDSPASSSPAPLSAIDEEPKQSQPSVEGEEGRVSHAQEETKSNDITANSREDEDDVNKIEVCVD